MKIAFSALLLSTLAACATYEPNTDGAAYRDQDVTTGSNIPRKGQAVNVDKSTITDVLSRSSGGAPTNGTGPR